MTNLPGTLAEVTPAWLSSVLSSADRNVTVDEVRVDRVIDGTATKARLRITYAGPGADGLPTRLWIKGGYGRESAKVMPTGAYAVEARFYRDLSPRIPVVVPTCYFADCDETTQQGVVLLADLAQDGVEFCNAARPLTVDQVASFLELLVPLHAFWWQSAELDTIPWLRSPLERGTPSDRYVSRFSAADLDAFVAMPRADVVPAGITGQGVVDALHALQDRVTLQPQCLLHGDTHLGNTYLRRDGSPGLLDWQTAWRGNWAHDVAYFITSALTVEDRRRHERDLLRHYLAALAAAGAAAPGFDEAWDDYRRYVAYGLFIWLINPVEAQPDEVNIPNITRFSAAADDLDTFGALGVKAG
ncbi:phosphotransferase [Streptodolium elevatio]|uniref:Phosphotransferase n=1 Tax=Streptodolium elevatio TaxID=3157996 RepID=A0ABV3DR97_9ACTN